MIKLFHTGDIHLDTPFAAASPKTAALRRRELRESFLAMMAGAVSEGAQMILVAGDVFDSEFVTSETVELVRDAFQRVSVPVVVSPGNHDPADGRGVWDRCTFSDNVYIFRTPTLSRFSFPELGVDVYGYAFTSKEMTESPVAGEFIRDTGKRNILLCHADITSPVSRNAPISREQIAAFGADYTALGHIHLPEKYSGTADGKVYAYSGCLMGRDFGECGHHGAVFAEISDEGYVSVSRRVYSRKHYEDISVAVDGAVSESEIYAAALAAAADVDGDTILRLTLTGGVDPDIDIDIGVIEAKLSHPAELCVRDHTTPSLTFAEGDMTVRGEYVRLLMPHLRSADAKERETALLALKMGLAAMSGNDPV